MAHLGRTWAREALRTHDATLVAMAMGQDAPQLRREWRDTLRAAARW